LKQIVIFIFILAQSRGSIILLLRHCSRVVLLTDIYDYWSMIEHRSNTPSIRFVTVLRCRVYAFYSHVCAKEPSWIHRI